MARARKQAVQSEAQAAEAPLDFTKSFQKLKPETFWRLWVQYPNREAISVYVYRLYPVIDRLKAGKDAKNIAIYTEPITELDFLRAHGSGKYQLQFNDSNRPPDLRQVATCILSLDDVDYPPVIAPGELVMNAPDNQSYVDGLRARGLMKEASVSQNDSNVAVAELAKTNREIITRVMETQSADKAAPAPDPFGIALRMIELQKGMAPAPPPAADPFDIALKIVTLIQPAMQPAKAADPLESYVKVKQIMEEIAPKSAPASEGGGWGSMVLEFVKALPQLMQGFMMMQHAQAAGAGPGVAGVPMAALPPQTPTPPQETLVPMTGEQIDVNVLLQQLRPFVLKALMRGQDGDEFADFVVTLVSQDAYEKLRALGMDGLLNYLKSQADLWPMLSSFEPQVREWLQAFLDAGKDPDAPTGEGPQAAGAEA